MLNENSYEHEKKHSPMWDRCIGVLSSHELNLDAYIQRMGTENDSYLDDAKKWTRFG